MDHLSMQPGVAEHLRSILGETLAVSAEVEQMLVHMYAVGVADTLEMLGIDEEDLPQGEGAVAWTA